MILESCCETIEEAVKAERNGATRIEFCRDLSKEGLTPKVKDVELLLTRVNIPVRVMIRPSDSFLISKEDLAACVNSIRAFEAMPLQGYVAGYLTKHGAVDLATLALLLGESPRPFTFHKAIDNSSNIMKSLGTIEILEQIDTVLSSGGEITAMEGSKQLLEMQAISNKTIMAGGKVTKENLAAHHALLHLRAYHGTKIV